MTYQSPLVRSSNAAKFAFGLLLFSPIIIAGLVIAIPLALISPLLPKKKVTPPQVGQSIRDFLNGDGGEWDWDDFTSIPFDDPRLDAIARRAGQVPLPLDEAGEAMLRALVAEAEGLAAAERDLSPSPPAPPPPRRRARRR